MTSTTQAQRSARRTLRASLWGLLLSAVMVLAACAESAPKHPLRLFDGGMTSPSQWQGQWVLINYWADWCGPCREEVPELNHLNDSAVGFTVLGVNYDYLQGGELQASIDALGITFPTLLDDPQMILGYDEATVLPMTVVIAPDGALHRVLVGPQTADTLLAAKAEPAQPTPQM